MSKEKVVKGIIKKYNPQSETIFLNGQLFNIKHLSDEKKSRLKEGIEVELKLKGKNVVDIKILSKVDNQKKIQNTHNSIHKKSYKESKPKAEQNSYNNLKGNYIVPEYLLKSKAFEEKIENYYLILNKYAFASAEKINNIPDNLKETLEMLKNEKLKLKIENVPNITNHFFSTSIDFRKEYNETIGKLSYIDAKSITFKPDYKLIIGLGSPSVYEVSMTLHHIYGFPYIPGPAIKGVLRNYVINEYCDLDEKRKLEIIEEVLNKPLKNFEELGKENRKDQLKVYNKIAEKKEEEALKNPLFQFIFGSQEKEGNIIFFDAFPEGKIKIEIDIMNNHFPDYYEDDKNQTPPADYQNPRPIKFLVVKDTPFKFHIGMKKNLQIENSHKRFDNEEKLANSEQILSYMVELLKEALEYGGIGAKTSVGYGFMSEK